MLRIVLRITGLAVHLAIAYLLVGTMFVKDAERTDAVEQLRSRSRSEEQRLDQQRRDLHIDQARLEGLTRQDPYVVELIARERYGYRMPGDIAPPPLDDTEP